MATLVVPDVPERVRLVMIDRFSNNAKKTMNLARQEAQRLGHTYLGHEHILLALIVLPECTAAKVISAQGITLEQIRSNVEERIKPATMVTMGQLPFTQAAKKVLELAMQEVANLGHRYIGTEHLLLGVMGVDDDIAAGALKELGCEIGRTTRGITDRAALQLATGRPLSLQ